MDVVLFGDQTVDPKQFLLKLLRRKGYPLLSSFFEQVQVALQDEVSFLPSRNRHNLPPFSNIAELVDRYYEAGEPEIGIESTLTCLAQLSHFIGYVASYPSMIDPANTPRDTLKNSHLNIHKYTAHKYWESAQDFSLHLLLHQADP